MNVSRWLVVSAWILGCGDNKTLPPEIDAPPACSTPVTLFLDRDGGTYTPGPDNASANTSSILDMERTLVAPTIADFDWDFVVGCVAQKFAPFNVVVTDQDPGDTVHNEMVVISTGADIGFGSNVASLSPFNCNRIDGAILYLMWDTNNINGDRCWSAAQSFASSLGLDHEFSCPDLMSFVTGCGATADKVFTDADMPCGEFEARACTCGGTTQNSFQYLEDKVGAACP